MHFADAKTLLTASGGARGMNLYRGCTHGCIYCDSRSRCYQFTHAFEDVEVKRNAPELLERALRGMRRRCVIGTGSMSDPYMPCEMELGLTRRCLEILERLGFGLAIQTKSDRILRDLDLLRAIHANAHCVAQMTLTTDDPDLCAVVEPRVCDTHRRLEALARLRDAGIPTVVWLSPILPFINDTEDNLRAILDGCAEVGVKGIVCFGMGLTLREGSREYYYAALDRHFPGLKRRYAETYGNAYEIASPNAERLMAIFNDFCARRDILHTPADCFHFMQTIPEKHQQISMFDPQ